MIERMKKMIEKANKEQNKEHAGFAVTFEVMFTLVLITTFLSFTLYFLRVMDVQRFMNTVMTSTAEQASRWGGVNSTAYKKNISNTPLLTTAQNQLNYIARDFNPIITGSPNKIANNDDLITIKITYKLPPIFNTMSKVYGFDSNSASYENLGSQLNDMSMQISVHSIMESGKLL